MKSTLWQTKTRGKLSVLPHLAEILGQEEKHKIEWNYLNKGAHEEDQAEEFDAAVVRHMLETVMKIDEALEKPTV
ncbi:hypothetical protein, partial [Escherichia coli]